MREINLAVIHCAATKPDMDIGLEEIKDWHVNGNGWSDVGYHWIIRRNGILETGRSESEVGAHAAGFNHDSIGICLVGGIDDEGESECNFTASQWKTLFLLCNDLKARYPGLKFKGHNELSLKNCPSFNVQGLEL